jgi:hypothetical protein
MPIKTMNDVEEERRQEKREKLKKEISEDVNEVIGNVFGKPEQKKKNIFGMIIKISLLVLLILIIVNLFLGNIWLLKFFIKILFGV